jgi:hypothetical protein
VHSVQLLLSLLSLLLLVVVLLLLPAGWVAGWLGLAARTDADLSSQVGGMLHGALNVEWAAVPAVATSPPPAGYGPWSAACHYCLLLAAWLHKCLARLVVVLESRSGNIRLLPFGR